MFDLHINSLIMLHEGRGCTQLSIKTVLLLFKMFALISENMCSQPSRATVCFVCVMLIL